jgi:plastocyanin
MKNTFSLLTTVLFVTISLLCSCKKTDPITVPELTTSPITSITFTSATSGGISTSDGKSAITAKGVCWSTSSNPTIEDSKTNDGSSTGQFISNLTGLTAGTTYFVRAYAINTAGTAYGNEVSFSTPPLQTAVVSTVAISTITFSTAVSGGNVSTDNGTAITTRGVCWSLTTGPIVAGSHTSDGTGLGSFVSNLTGLQNGTLYYVRAYATNSVGTAYGDEISFSTATVQPAVLATNIVSAITLSTAITGGNITADNGSAVTARGVCWSLTTGPTITGSHTFDGNGIGSFVSNLAGLVDGTQYFVRAYATNSAGTAYGNEVSFTTTAIPPANEVIIQSMAFIPQTLTVPVNSTVKWKNLDGITHTVTSDNASWDSGNIPAGSTFKFTFTATGTFHYHCTIHPLMTGTIIVQ